jgi:hypothetical protein
VLKGNESYGSQLFAKVDLIHRQTKGGWYPYRTSLEGGERLRKDERQSYFSSSAQSGRKTSRLVREISKGEEGELEPNDQPTPDCYNTS